MDCLVVHVESALGPIEIIQLAAIPRFPRRPAPVFRRQGPWYWYLKFKLFVLGPEGGLIQVVDHGPEGFEEFATPLRFHIAVYCLKKCF